MKKKLLEPRPLSEEEMLSLSEKELMYYLACQLHYLEHRLGVRNDTLQQLLKTAALMTIRDVVCKGSNDKKLYSNK